MRNTLIDRRTFSQLLAMSIAATAAPVLPAWAQGKKRNVVIGHTGITWPGRTGGARGVPPPPPDPAMNETIFKDVAEVGYAGLELIDFEEGVQHTQHDFRRLVELPDQFQTFLILDLLGQNRPHQVEALQWLPQIMTGGREDT